MSGPVPEWVLNALAAGTVFTVMLSVGLSIAAFALIAAIRLRRDASKPAPSPA